MRLGSNDDRSNNDIDVKTYVRKCVGKEKELMRKRKEKKLITFNNVSGPIYNKRLLNSYVSGDSQGSLKAIYNRYQTI